MSRLCLSQNWIVIGGGDGDGGAPAAASGDSNRIEFECSPMVFIFISLFRLFTNQTMLAGWLARMSTTTTCRGKDEGADAAATARLSLLLLLLFGVGRFVCVIACVRRARIVRSFVCLCVCDKCANRLTQNNTNTLFALHLSISTATTTTTTSPHHCSGPLLAILFQCTEICIYIV